jgi:hypothetical protein
VMVDAAELSLGTPSVKRRNAVGISIVMAMRNLQVS